MNSAASKHICRDQKMFDTLKIDGEFDHFKLRDGGKMKVEGTRSVRMKLHDGVIRTFSNVRFVPSAVVNMISMGEMTSQGYKYVSSKWGCKVYKGRYLVLQRQKNKDNLCYLDNQVLKRNHDSKVKKKVKFFNIVEVLGDTSLEGKFVHSQINWRIFLFWLEGENYRVSSQKIRCMHIEN